MSLRPCLSCRRHVIASSEACVFCAAPLPPPPARVPVVVSALTRAAVFAGATLASSCVVVQDPPARQPAPADRRPGAGQPGDGATGGGQTGAGSFAQPPGGGGSAQAPRAGAVTVVVTDMEGQPRSDWSMQLVAPGGQPRFATSNSAGVVTFTDVPPGRYQLTYDEGTPPRRGIPISGTRTVDVMVEPGQVTTLPVTVSSLPAPRYDAHQQPMPYGAPPARRRVV